MSFSHDNSQGVKKICLNCQHLNKPKYLFCTKCGSPLEPPKSRIPRLALLNQDKSSHILRLGAEKSIIGRDSTNTISLIDEQVSRKHAIIYFDQGKYWIEDLKSKNGVWVNGKKISSPQRLINGSLIKIGASMLRFELYTTLE